MLFRSKVSPTYAAKEQEIKIPADDELLELIKEFRQLSACSDPSLLVVFKKSLKSAIQNFKKEKSPSKARAQHMSKPALPVTTSSEKRSNESKITASPEKLKKPQTPEPKKNTRYVPRKLLHQIWMRDQGQCTYADPNTKRRCQARYHLQLDHIRPFALDGETKLENLRLLCRAHNQHEARKTFEN